MYDLYIKNAEIIDGTGNPRRRGDLAVKDGKMKLMKTQEESAAEIQADRLIDGTGLILSPGFIDAHSHGDLVAGHDYARLCKTSQGITTEVAGQCGSSCFPVTADSIQEVISNSLMLGELEREHMAEFTGFRGYRDFLSRQQLSANIMVFTGHSTLRMAVMGTSDAKPDGAQLQKMQELLKEAMEDGSAGLSTGLFYPPSAYADVEEISALCAVVAEYGGIHTTHMRNEGSEILKSMEEVFEASRRTGCALNISHHKICGKKNWGLSEETLKMAGDARKEGLNVTMDVYPYTASMTKLAACIPTEYFVKGTGWLADGLKSPELRLEIREKMEAFEDGRYNQCGGFSGIMIGGCPGNPEADGKFLSDYAAEQGRDPFEVFFDLVMENKSKCSAIYFSMDQADLDRIILSPYTMVGTDGLTISMDGKTHPRSWASFPRAVRLFVREKNLMSLEQMIHKITELPARTYHMNSKGRIQDGMDADLVLFDENTIGDAADFVHSTRLSNGIRFVIVNGRIVYEGQKMTGCCPGTWTAYHKD